MGRNVIKISFLAFLTLALVCANVFCCCIAEASETAVSHQEHMDTRTCCPRADTAESGEQEDECLCQSQIRSAKPKPVNFDTQPEFNRERISKQNDSPAAARAVVFWHHAARESFSSDPPLYIKNSVYRI